MKKLTLSLIAAATMMSSFAFADVDYGLEVGIRQQSGDADAPSTTDSKMALQFGATANFPITGPLHFRTGMLYTQRPLTVKTFGSENKISLNYHDVPLALMYKFEEYAGVYGGVSLGFNLDKKSDIGTLEDVKSPLVSALVGVAFKFAPNLGLNLYFESAGDTAKTLKNFRAVGANLQITFD